VLLSQVRRCLMFHGSFGNCAPLDEVLGHASLLNPPNSAIAPDGLPRQTVVMALQLLGLIFVMVVAIYPASAVVTLLLFGVPGLARGSA
jgi:hypothetical protein